MGMKICFEFAQKRDIILEHMIIPFNIWGYYDCEDYEEGDAMESGKL
jgi:hypothetical protein